MRNEEHSVTKAIFIELNRDVTIRASRYFSIEGKLGPIIALEALQKDIGSNAPLCLTDQSAEIADVHTLFLFAEDLCAHDETKSFGKCQDTAARFLLHTLLNHQSDPVPLGQLPRRDNQPPSLGVAHRPCSSVFSGPYRALVRVVR